MAVTDGGIAFHCQKFLTVVGYAIIRPHNRGAQPDPAIGDVGRINEIGELYVCPSHRRHGVGSALVTRVIDLSRADRCGYVVVNVWPRNDPALAFFAKQGFIFRAVPAFTHAVRL